MSMTKQDFIALAEHVRSVANSPSSLNPMQIEELADFCAQQNPAFNRERWLDYIAGKCGKNVGRVK